MRLEIRWHRIDASLRFAVCPALGCEHSIQDPSFSSLKRRMCRHLCHVHQIHNHGCRHNLEPDDSRRSAQLTWTQVRVPQGGSNPCRMCWSREYRDVVMGLELCGMCKRSLNQVLNFLEYHGYVVQRVQPLEDREPVQDHQDQATGADGGQEPGPRARGRGAGRGSRSEGSSESPQSSS